MRIACLRRPSLSSTSIWSMPSMTWLFVTMWPSLLTMAPLPCAPSGTASALAHAADGRRRKSGSSLWGVAMRGANGRGDAHHRGHDGLGQQTMRWRLIAASTFTSAALMYGASATVYFSGRCVRRRCPGRTSKAANDRRSNPRCCSADSSTPTAPSRPRRADSTKEQEAEKAFHQRRWNTIRSARPDFNSPARASFCGFRSGTRGTAGFPDGAGRDRIQKDRARPSGRAASIRRRGGGRPA